MALISDRLSFRIAVIASLLALVVVTLGAYTRLKDAGLGCPDWPGCYGHLLVPTAPQQLQQVTKTFPQQVVEPAKAWPEMIHRYVAGSLAILIFILMARALKRFRQPGQPVVLPLILGGLVLFQAALGMWTVTLRLLPPVVMSHLLGGMTVLSLLVLLSLQLSGQRQALNITEQAKFKIWASIGLVILVAQIALGGWTSSNYAALVCHDFPFCHGELIPPLHFEHALNLWMQIGPNYQGGVLDDPTRITIHMLHRLGAVVAFSYLTGLSLALILTSRSRLLFRLGQILLALLIVQVTLGILNIVLMLPIQVAVAHNGTAAVLLATLVALNYSLYRQQAQ